MASTVDGAIPADNVRVEKTKLRENFRKTRDEITALQQRTSLAYRIAVGDQSMDDR